MGVSEALVKVIFWPRVRRAKQIGKAAELIGQGRPEECLERLSKLERRIPPYVGHLFFLTRGRALDDLKRFEEAEQSYVAAVFAKEGASIAYIHLAVLCGRLRRFDEARDWIRRIREDEEAEEELLEQSNELENMFDEIEDGRRLAELRERGLRFAEAHELDGLSLTEAATRLDQWASEHAEDAQEECDELACFLGEALLRERSGQWLISLNLEDSIVFIESKEINPFELVRARLSREKELAPLLEHHLSREG